MVNDSASLHRLIIESTKNYHWELCAERGKKIEKDFGKGGLFHRNVFANKILSLEKFQLGKVDFFSMEMFFKNAKISYFSYFALFRRHPEILLYSRTVCPERHQLIRAWIVRWLGLPNISGLVLDVCLCCDNSSNCWRRSPKNYTKRTRFKWIKNSPIRGYQWPLKTT